jgi:hypothetical protein
VTGTISKEPGLTANRETEPKSLVRIAISTLGPKVEGKICTSVTVQSSGRAGRTIAVAARISAGRQWDSA